SQGPAMAPIRADRGLRTEAFASWAARPLRRRHAANGIEVRKGATGQVERATGPARSTSSDIRSGKWGGDASGSGHRDADPFSVMGELVCSPRKEEGRHHGRGEVARLEVRGAGGTERARLPGPRRVPGQTLRFQPNTTFRGPLLLLVKWGT